MRRENEGVGVDVGEHGAVDADGGAGAGVVAIAWVADLGEIEPFPDRKTRVAALDETIEIIPVVENPVLDLGGAGDVEGRDGLAGLDAAQKFERAVENTDIAVRTNDQCAFRNLL